MRLVDTPVREVTHTIVTHFLQPPLYFECNSLAKKHKINKSKDKVH